MKIFDRKLIIYEQECYHNIKFSLETQEIGRKNHENSHSTHNITSMRLEKHSCSHRPVYQRLELFSCSHRLGSMQLRLRMNKTHVSLVQNLCSLMEHLLQHLIAPPNLYFKYSTDEIGQEPVNDMKILFFQP